jgi:hypothetical protein
MAWDVEITIHLLNACHRNAAALGIMLLREGPNQLTSFIRHQNQLNKAKTLS